MDRIIQYRDIVAAYLREQAAIPYPSTVNLTSVAVIDRENDNYLLLTIGSDKTGRIHSTDIHLAIEQAKVRLLVAETDWEILKYLAERGIDRADLVDATQTPEPTLSR